ncbi:flavoprotein [Polychytrium aggregatum]|uniref:flavoprotein n=1 Tax=Polychytrium aggregatum TaxID=110093 RepID=UPI0022FDE211|nr:flavoprotein [Polychytrium aggregatum]KAI9203844.1 flavoprotein [Polychytrium aggregatum]
MLQKKRILIGTTGSVASVKLPMLINELRKIFGDFVEIRVVATTPSLHFFKKEDISVPVVTDVDEWNAWSQMGDPVLHIELRNWADIMVVAPLDANTLAKLAAGICDNLLTCTLRAWDPSRPVVVCPAMNTHMWTHPFTQKHLDVLAAEASYIIIPPITKTLACGDTGIGAMENVDRVAQRIYEILEG